MIKHIMTRKFTAGVFVVAVLAFGRTAHATEEASPQAYFYPSKKWIVEKVEDSSAGPVCALGNEFNNGFIVQIGGSGDGFSNLNIDFRQPSFEKDKKYDVVFGVPGKADLSVSSTAYSESLLVSDLRGQEKFSNALGGAGVVDVQIAGNAFRLYLTGLDAVMGDYRKCLEGVPAEVPKPVDVVAEAESAPESVVAMPADVATLPAAAPEKTTVTKTVSPPEIKTVKETRYVEADFTQSGPSDSRILEMERAIADLQRERDMLNAQLKDTLKSAQEERMSLSSDDWDLERATMRFNEAELQIKRLGTQLQIQKDKCDMEKKDLEAMLFDPQVTDAQQLARLESLEEELKQTKESMAMQERTYLERIKILETQLSGAM